MLTDTPPPYRWQDRVIPPRRAARNLKATALIVAVLVIAAVLLDGHASSSPTHAVRATEQTPSLARLVKPAILPAPESPAPEAAALKGC
jgi:hypothetical protein